MSAPGCDEQLVLRAQLGDRGALSQLVHRHHEPVLAFLNQLTLDPATADDLVQETWLRALRGLAGLRSPDRFEAWLYTIARRTAADRLRVRYRRREAGDEGIDGAELDRLPDPPPALDDVDRLAVAESIRDLELGLREVVWLHYWAGLPVDEVGRVLDIPPGTVKSRLHRARRHLAVAQQNAEPPTEPTRGSHR